MEVTPAGDTRNSKKSKINRSLLNTILLVIIVIVLSAGGGYAIGFQMGKKAGAKATISKVTDFLNPLNAVSDNPLFPSTTVGSVSGISKSSITVKQPNGNEKKSHSTAILK